MSTTELITAPPRSQANFRPIDRRSAAALPYERFLTEHLLNEKGREEKTVDDYGRLHAKWFSPEIGDRRVRDVNEQTIDRIFGRMRRAGLSRSRINVRVSNSERNPSRA